MFWRLVIKWKLTSELILVSKSVTIFNPILYLFHFNLHCFPFASIEYFKYSTELLFHSVQYSMHIKFVRLRFYFLLFSQIVRYILFGPFCLHFIHLPEKSVLEHFLIISVVTCFKVTVNFNSLA